MIPQNRIKERLSEFLKLDEVKMLMDNCTWHAKGKIQIGESVRIGLYQRGDGDLEIQITTNSKDGFNAFTKHYNL